MRQIRTIEQVGDNGVKINGTLYLDRIRVTITAAGVLTLSFPGTGSVLEGHVSDVNINGKTGLTAEGALEELSFLGSSAGGGSSSSPIDVNRVITHPDNWKTLTGGNAQAALNSTDMVLTSLGGNVEANGESIEQLSGEIDRMQGLGGALTAADLGKAPTNESLTEYACRDIWGDGVFTWNEKARWDSTFVVGSKTHHVSEIFSNTWVRNKNADPSQIGHKWVLTNTQKTNPRVFSWEDAGQDVVSPATETFAGVIKANVEAVVYRETAADALAYSIENPNALVFTDEE